MISVKDGNGNLVGLKSTLVSGEQVPHHVVESSALPTGAATETTVAAVAAALVAQATKLESQPVTVSGGALTGQATATLQTNIYNKLVEVLASCELRATQATLANIQNALAGNLYTITATRTGSRTTVGPLVGSGTSVLVPNGAAAKTIYQLQVGNPSAVDAWLLLKDGGTEIYRILVPGGTSAQYEPSRFVALTGTVGVDITANATESGTGMYVTAVHS